LTGNRIATPPQTLSKLSQLYKVHVSSSSYTVGPSYSLRPTPAKAKHRPG
jgi:hypothetical protein